MANGERPTLQRLARLHGVQAAYRDGCGRPRRATPDAVRAILRALGAPLGAARAGDLRAATAARLRTVWTRPVEPVLVAWGGRRTDFLLRLPDTPHRPVARCRLRLENGRTRSWTAGSSEAPAVDSAVVDGTRYDSRLL